MCYKPTQAEREARRATSSDRQQHDARRPWRNTRPRANPEPDRRDLERSAERLEAVLGR